MKEKLRLAMYWGAGCGGCDIAVLELHESLLTVLDKAEIVFWPCIADFKVHDLQAMADGAIDLCLYNGAIRNADNVAMARLLRQKSKALVAFGACATSGGIPGLANLSTREELLQRVYLTNDSTVNDAGRLPQAHCEVNGSAIELPALLPSVQALADIVPVDYVMPGCPPAASQISRVLGAAVSGRLPPPGSIIGAGDKSVCDECPLQKRQVKVRAFKRITEIIPDGRTCLLEQGLVCLGPATRSGCGAQCLSVSMPCRGCYGAAGEAEDQGAKMVGLIGSVVEPESEAEIAACVDAIPDPEGTFYRFGFATSTLRRAKR